MTVAGSSLAGADLPVAFRWFRPDDGVFDVGGGSDGSVGARQGSNGDRWTCPSISTS